MNFGEFREKHAKVNAMVSQVPTRAAKSRQQSHTLLETTSQKNSEIAVAC